MAIFDKVLGKKDDLERTLDRLDRVVTDLESAKAECSAALDSENYNRANQIISRVAPLYDEFNELAVKFIELLVIQEEFQIALDEIEKFMVINEGAESFFNALGIEIDDIKALNLINLEIFRGTILFDLKKYRMALKSFDTILEMDDSYHNIWVLSGDALLELGYNDDALDAYDRALEIVWHDADAWAGKGQALYLSGRPEEALEAYETALEIDESNEAALEGKETLLAGPEDEDDEAVSETASPGIDPGTPGPRGHGKKVFKRPADTKKDDKPRGFECVAGMNELKDLLRRDVIKPLKNPESYERFNVTIPNGILLYGPPGCGKTFIVEKLAEEVGYHFINVPPSKLGSKFIHETSDNIAKVFQEAKNNSPTILFFDEFEALVPKRESLGSEGQYKNEEINEFLTRLNNASSQGILVVGATNQVELIDSAVMRAGRMDKVILVPPPDFDARKELFRSKITKVPHSDDIDFDELSEKTEFYSSSDIAAITAAAGRIAGDQELDEINRDLMLHVLETQKPSISRSQIESYMASSHLERK